MLTTALCFVSDHLLAEQIKLCETSAEVFRGLDLKLGSFSTGLSAHS